MKVNIFTFVFNRPDFLERQYRCFKEKLKDEFTFNVVLDYKDEKYLNIFKEICSNNNWNLLLNHSNLSLIDEGNCFELHMNKIFLHFKNASRWDKHYQVNYLNTKTKILDKLLKLEY